MSQTDLLGLILRCSLRLFICAPSACAARLDGLLALTSAAYIAAADLKADEALGADKVRRVLI